MSVRTFSVKEHKQTHRFKTAIDKNVIPQVITGVGWGYDEGYLEWEKKVLKNRLPNMTFFRDNDLNDYARYHYLDFDGILTENDGIYVTYPIPYKGASRCKITAVTEDNTPYGVAIAQPVIEATYTELASGSTFEQVFVPDDGLNSNLSRREPNWRLSTDTTGDSGYTGYPLTVICAKNDTHYGEIDLDVGDFFYFFPYFITVGGGEAVELETPSSMDIGVANGAEYQHSYIPYGSRLYIIKRKLLDNQEEYEYTLSFEPYNTKDPENNNPIYVKFFENETAVTYSGFYLPYDPVTLRIFSPETSGRIREVTIGQADEVSFNQHYDNCRFVRHTQYGVFKLRLCSSNLVEFTTGETEKLSNASQSLHTCESMFEGCSSLRKVYPFNSYHTSTKKMFKDCVSLKASPYIMMGQTTDAESMFENCTSLVEVSGFTTITSLTNVKKMFKNCRSLQLLNYFDVLNVQYFDEFLFGCHSLQFIPWFDFVSTIYGENLSPFGENYSLVSGTFTVYKTRLVDLSNTKYDAAALNYIFDSLYNATVQTEKPTIIITGAIGAAGCDQSIATLKDWIVISS